MITNQTVFKYFEMFSKISQYISKYFNISVSL